MGNKSDELRSALPAVAAEMDHAIGDALRQIRAALRIAEHTQGEVGWAWKKGLSDALLLLRPARDAQARYERWRADVLAQDVDACGLTADERAAMLQRDDPA